MLFVVFGADCDHVGDIYECPQGTYVTGFGKICLNEASRVF